MRNQRFVRIVAIVVVAGMLFAVAATLIASLL